MLSNKILNGIIAVFLTRMALYKITYKGWHAIKQRDQTIYSLSLLHLSFLSSLFLFLNKSPYLCLFTQSAWLRICQLYPLWLGKMPKMVVLDMSLNCIWWCGSSYGDRENMEYFFIAIVPSSTQNWNRSTSEGHIYGSNRSVLKLFESISLPLCIYIYIYIYIYMYARLFIWIELLVAVKQIYVNNNNCDT